MRRESGRGLAGNLREGDVRVLVGRVVTPHDDVLDVGVRGAGLVGELRDRTVVVEAHHRGEARGRDVRRSVLGDGGVGVRGVAHDEDAHVVSGAVVDGLALGAEDARVGLEQVGALHALAARHGTHQVRDVGALECTVDVVEDLNAGQGRERAVIELHGGALGGLDSLGDLEQVQLDGHVRAEQLAEYIIFFKSASTCSSRVRSTLEFRIFFHLFVWNSLLFHQKRFPECCFSLQDSHQQLSNNQVLTIL